MRTCPRCGGKVSDIAKFCEQCGVNLDEQPTDGSLQPKEEQAPEEVQENIEFSEKTTENTKSDVEELDLTALDKKVVEGELSKKEAQESVQDKPKAGDNIIDLKDVLESEEKVEMDSSIKREVLADEEVFSKICPMCGEEMQINKKLLEDTPVMVKCLKCGHETKIW